MTHARLPPLLTRNLAEIIGKTQLINHFQHFPHLLTPQQGTPPVAAPNNNIKPLSLYWGTAPTSTPHFGYFLPLLKLRDFLNVNINVTILLADIHAALDKIDFEKMNANREFYEFVLRSMLRRIGVHVHGAHDQNQGGTIMFRTGSEFQLSPEYCMDVYRMSHISTIDSARGASAMVVKQIENPVLSSIMYPILQALDEEYLNADIQFGGVDQRKIFMFARENLPRIGYRKRSYLMNPLIPALSKGGKMSSSDASSKIDLRDSDEDIQRKLRKAYSIDGQPTDNGILAILRYIIFPMLESEQRQFLMERPQKYGGNMTFASYESLEHAFVQQDIASVDLKENVAREIISLIAPVRQDIEDNVELFERAYGKVRDGAQDESATGSKAKGGIYTLFIEQQMQKLKQQHPDLSEDAIMKQFSTTIKNQFKQLSKAEKQALLEQV